MIVKNILFYFIGYLLNQSKEFVFAIIFSYLEYLIEIYFFPNIKSNKFSLYLGVILMVIGHIFRIGGMFTAKSNFTHLIAFKKEEKHKLVTDGLYK